MLRRASQHPNVEVRELAEDVAPMGVSSGAGSPGW